MRAYNVTEMQLQKALVRTNKKYKGNIMFREIKPINGAKTTWQFTITVKDSKAPGHRRGYGIFNGKWQSPDRLPAKRLRAACWHAHGDFFDAIFDIAKNAKIRTGKVVMVSKADNWQDYNIGSQIFPLYFSEACDCNT